ncbi:MAG: GNAT family N-acetyltransferase [Muribaculum sp.]|nr:GNAT family N-acetyltransferase [Muribaculum sp.]
MDTIICPDNQAVRWRICRYQKENAREWDEFVATSRNGHFMHKRSYMDYHADRFADHSLMAYKGGRLLAVLPANEEGEVICSHRGLTFGGWLLPARHLDGTDLLEIFQAMVEYLRQSGFKSLVYKAIPYIYPEMPSQEDLYSLFRFGATVEACNLSETISMGHNPGYNTMTRRHLRKVEASGAAVETIREVNASEFYPLLEKCLRERHKVTPVHTQRELEMLKEQFPENIRCYMCGNGAFGQAGVCIYYWRGVAHCQYIATDKAGRKNNMLTLLFNYLIGKEYAGARYFDFGTSNEHGGRYLNAGLLRQKSGYGASGVAYTIYEMEI